MSRPRRRARPVRLLPLLLAAACGGAAARPAPADVRPTPTAEPRDATPSVPPAAMPANPGTAGAPRKHTAADTRFMQGMIGHHAQALAMTALVPTRTDRREIRLIAERIEVSQRDEIALMESWLRDRGEPVPASDEHAHHEMPAGEHHAGMAHDAAMPGMLTPTEMARLAEARGPAFDRLFLESMIRHHEGALTMVARLLATPGAAQESDTYGFVSDVDTDQRAEIRRMRSVLATK